VAGLTYTWDASVAPNEGRIQQVMVREGDSFVPIDPAKTYGVASNNFVRNGGDGFNMFETAENAYDFGPDVADVVAEYMAANGANAVALEGRITRK